MANFRIEYDEVIDQAEEMGDLASELEREIRVLEELRLQIKSEWIGPASEAYQKQLLKLIADLKATRSDMSSVANTVKRVARNIQRTDEAIARAARDD